MSGDYDMPVRGAKKTSALVLARALWGIVPRVDRNDPEMQEAVTTCRTLRPRGTARPSLKVYKAGLPWVGGSGLDIHRDAKDVIWNLCMARDRVADDDLADYDGALIALATVPVRFALDARAASDKRRRLAAQRRA